MRRSRAPSVFKVPLHRPVGRPEDSTVAASSSTSAETNSIVQGAKRARFAVPASGDSAASAVARQTLTPIVNRVKSTGSDRESSGNEYYTVLYTKRSNKVSRCCCASVDMPP